MNIYLSDTVKQNKRRERSDLYSSPNRVQTKRSGLADHYKPVGIAALAAVALCMKAAGKTDERPAQKRMGHDLRKDKLSVA